MSDLLRMTGMYSGMDTESIVSQLVKTKSTKVTNLKNEQKKLEWKQTAWQDLNSKIYNMYSKTLSNLRLTSAYSKKSTVSSDSTKATVVASEGAVNGTQTLQVNKLAKSGYLTGAKLAGKTTTTTGTDGKDVTKVVNWETTDKLSEIDSNLTGKTISLTTGTGTDAKTTDIEITADMTINDLVAKFKDAGVNASFDTTNQRFFINSTGTGSAKNFTLSSDDSTALASLGLDPNATYTDINGSKNSCVKIEGQDAEIVLNGATFTSDSNTFSINGLTINTLGVYGSVAQSFRYSIFQVASIITTTGFATTDFGMLPMLSQILILLLMVVGACAGSTGGGMKISRIMILIKSAKSSVKKMVSLRSVSTINVEGKPVDKQVLDFAYSYFVVYALIFFASVLLLSFENLDIVTTLTAPLTCLGNVGPGFGDLIGPVGNFASLSNFSKIVLSFDMLAGRLELFPMILLCYSIKDFISNSIKETVKR